MITERRFAASHHGFWHELLPMGERYLRVLNENRTRYIEAFAPRTAPQLNGVVNEVAFRLFARCSRDKISLRSVASGIVDEEESAARAFIEAFRQHGRGPLPPLTEHGRDDAIDLARRIEQFFEGVAPSDLTLQPHFQGCGWLSECDGDAFGNGVLYEVKAGDRSFRMLDVRQVLTYCA